MVSPHRLVGKLSRERASLLVFGGKERQGSKKHKGIRTRTGSRVKINTRKQALASAKEQGKDRFLKAYSKFIEQKQKSTDTRVKASLVQIMTTRNLLRATMKRGITSPTVYQLLAVHAYTIGLGKEALLPVANHLRNVYQNYKGMVFWNGNPNLLTQAIRQDLPLKIEELLRSEKRILDSREIAQKLGVKTSPDKINVALQLLDAMGVVEKHLMHSSKNTARATFSHRTHGTLPIVHPNSELSILMAAYESGAGVQAKELFTQKTIRGKYKTGSVNGEFYSSSITRAARLLVKKGLIAISKDSSQHYNPTTYTLTEKGLELMQKFFSNKKRSFRELRETLLWE